MGGWYNLTSNLFTLIIPLTTHNNTSDICSYKPYTEKKTRKKKYVKKINREKKKKRKKNIKKRKREKKQHANNDSKMNRHSEELNKYSIFCRNKSHQQYCCMIVLYLICVIGLCIMCIT